MAYLNIIDSNQRSMSGRPLLCADAGQRTLREPSWKVTYGLAVAEWCSSRAWMSVIEMEPASHDALGRQHNDNASYALHHCPGASSMARCQVCDTPSNSVHIPVPSQRKSIYLTHENPAYLRAWRLAETRCLVSVTVTNGQRHKHERQGKGTHSRSACPCPGEGRQRCPSGHSRHRQPVRPPLPPRQHR